MAQIIKRGLFMSFSPTSYTAAVLILEATNAQLTSVPVATHIDGTSAQSGALCAVLFFDQNNTTDGVVIAVYPNGSSGIPTPAPGRVVFVTGTQQITAQTINNGSTSTFTLNSGGIPGGALAVVCKVQLTSSTAGALAHLAPHGASDITAYMTIGGIQVVNATIYESGLLPLDTQGRIDIKAVAGNCVIWLTTYGYIM